MSTNVYRPKSLVTAKYKSSTPISQPSSKNMKKRDSLRVGQDVMDQEMNDNNQRNRDTGRLKSNRNFTGQQQMQNNYYTGSTSGTTNGLLYFGGNIGGQNTSISNKRLLSTSGLNNQNSKEYCEKVTDEFNDFNIVQKKLQINLEEMGEDANNGIPKKIKQTLNLKSLPNQAASLQQSTTPTGAVQNALISKNKMGNQLQNSVKGSQKGDKYISIKDTIAAYKEVEQKIVMKTNELNGRPPLLISTNNQIPVSSITPSSIAQNQIQLLQQSQQQQPNSLKHVYSDDRLNIIGSSCQQGSQNNSEKKGIPSGIALNQRPGQQNGNHCNSTSSNHTNSTTNNNKENSTAASSSSHTSAQATNGIFSYLVNPSAALPPSRLNNINVFRIKKQQSSTRNSFIQQNHPSSQSFIPQTSSSTSQSTNGQQHEIKNNFSIQQLVKQQQNQSHYSDDEEDICSIDGNISNNNISTNNIHSIPSNLSKSKKKASITVQTPFTPNQFHKQESIQLERNSSKNISSSRYVQVNRQIVSAQRPPKSQTKVNSLLANTNNTHSTNQLNDNTNNTATHHTKRNSEKYTTNLLYAQSHWSPEASICQQDDIGLDQFQISTNRSQSSQHRPNKFHNSSSADYKKEINKSESNNKNTPTTNIKSGASQNLLKSNLFLKQKKDEYRSEVLQMMNSSEIKPIYWKSSTIDNISNSDYDRNILIIKAENLLFGGFTSQSYWDKKDCQGINYNMGSGNMGGMINFNGISNSYSNSNISTPYGNVTNNGQGDIYGNKLNEIKRILRTLSKHYLIFLLFNSCSKKVRDLVSYMIKTNFTFDGAYYIYSPQANSLYSNKTVNLQQIIIDYKLTNHVNKVVIFDAVPANFQVNINQNNSKRGNFRTPSHATSQKKKNLSNHPTRSRSGVINVESEPNLLGGEKHEEEENDDEDTLEEKSNPSSLNTYKLKRESHYDLLQEFIPKFEEKIIEKTKVILFKQRINPNLLQANQKKVLEVALSFVDPRVKQFTNNLYFINLDIADVTEKAYEEGTLNSRKKNFLKQINKIKQQNKNTKDIIELDGDKVAENFRNRLIEYMKSTHKSIHNLYYLVGDLVVRNRNIFQKLYADPFHCKKKNIDNLLQLDILRYKPFPQLARQTFLRGKQAQEYANLIKQLPSQNPYDILFFPEENNNIEESDKSLKPKILDNSSSLLNIEDVEMEKQSEETKIAIERKEKKLKDSQKSKLSYYLPINIYLCTEVSM